MFSNFKTTKQQRGTEIITHYEANRSLTPKSHLFPDRPQTLKKHEKSQTTDRYRLYSNVGSQSIKQVIEQVQHTIELSYIVAIQCCTVDFLCMLQTLFFFIILICYRLNCHRRDLQLAQLRLESRTLGTQLSTDCKRI